MKPFVAAMLLAGVLPGTQPADKTIVDVALTQATLIDVASEPAARGKPCS